MAARSVCLTFNIAKGIFSKFKQGSHRYPYILTLTQRTAYSSSSDSGSDSDGLSEDRENDTKHRIFQASLSFVPQHGWSRKTLVCGAESIGLPTLAHGMIDGPAELVHFFYQDCNQKLADQMKEDVENMEIKGEKIHSKEFIRSAVETRLRMLTPYLDQWPQAIALQVLPQNAVRSWSDLADLVDEIWYSAGDRSTDFNWYTKRVSLAAVYKSTEIALIQDKSEDFADTWFFLDRRLNDLVKVGKTIRGCQQCDDQLFNGMKGAYIMTRNILGLNR